MLDYVEIHRSRDKKLYDNKSDYTRAEGHVISGVMELV